MAGAAIAHIHVRDPETGAPARRLELYEEVVELIRASGTDVVLNLTAGMGGDMTLGSPEAPLPPSEKGTDMVGATERLEHVAKLLPEICTLDCGTMNFGEGDYIMVNSPAMLKAMAGQIRDLGVRPEIEIFDGGHLVLAKWLKDQGLIDDPVMLQLCMGVPWGVARRHRHLHGAGQQSAAGLDLLGLFHRPQPAALCGARRAGRRQHPRGARGQSVARQRPARHQRAAGRARCADRRGHGLPDHRPG